MKQPSFPLRIASLYALALLALLPGACQKQFLETRPDKALLVPSTLADFRTLLDNLQVFNRSPGLTGIADGDLITTDAGFQSWGSDPERNSYIWAADIYGSERGYEWNSAYQQILYANVVLDGLGALPAGSDPAERSAVEGTALFSRAWTYYGLAQLFCPPYRAATAATDPGVPVRTSPDVTAVAPRGTLQQTYTQILSDLTRARGLLPAATAYKSRPGLPALYALFSRVYLMQGEYSRAGAYADSALRLSSELLDFNTLTASATRPMPRALPNGNPEIYYYSASDTYTFSVSTAVAYIEPALYASYAASDLRRTCYFRDQGSGRVNFKGSYSGSVAWFGGLTAGEALLTRAECAARAGNTAAAMADVNALLAKRYRTGSLVPLAAATPEAALQLILSERRKELVCRNLRWADLRRLSGDARLAVTLRRTLGGTVYTLEPGSRRYTYPLPPEEIKLTGLPQNER